MSDLSWLNPTPHAIAVYASRPLSPVATQHSLPSGRYSLLGPDFHRLDRTSLRLAHSFDHLVGLQSLWQATKNENKSCPVGSALANAPEVFSVEPEDFPAAKHVCESSVDRESKCPISSRQHYCKGLERKVVRKQRKVPQTLSPRQGEQYKLIAGKAIQIAACQCCNTLSSVSELDQCRA